MDAQVSFSHSHRRSSNVNESRHTNV